jgi:GlcNAc-P-P-Und epimerase
VHVGKSLARRIPAIHIPYGLGMAGGYGFDFLKFCTGRKFALSAIRVKKFCATTQFDATRAHSCGFVPPYTLLDGLDKTLRFEFLGAKDDALTFLTE